MDEIAISFYCSDILKQRTKVILNLIGSVTRLRFRQVDNDADIIYGDSEQPCKLHIPEIDYVFSPEEWQQFNGRSRLIVPGFIQARSLVVTDKKLGIDLFKLAYLFLVEGLNGPNKPRWDLAQIKTGLRHVYPFFNSYIDLFIDSLKVSGILPESYQRLSPWPNDAPFAVGISHDVDILKRKLPGGVKMLGKAVFSDSIPGGVNGSLVGLTESLKSTVSIGQNPYYQFSKWQELDNSATYFIYAGHRKSSNDPTYKINQAAQAIGEFDSKRLEIALHNGIGTSGNTDALEESRDKLARQFGVEVKGIRPHYLDFELPDFWTKARGFSYSSSIGSDTLPGFTGGINQPFFGFDFHAGTMTDILELPIGVMDCALMAIKDTILRERTIEDIIANMKTSYGLLVLDWHQRTAYVPDFPGWLATYEHIIALAKDAGAYIASLGEIDSYWRTHCASVFSS
jgi:hypothetical protein